MSLVHRRTTKFTIAGGTSLALVFAAVSGAVCFETLLSANLPTFAAERLLAQSFVVDPALDSIRMLMHEKRYSEAKAPLDAYLKRVPNSLLALLYRSRVYADENKYKEALELLKRAEKIDPANSETFGDQASIYATQKQYEKAIAAATASINYRRTNQNKNMFHLRSMMYSSVGQYKKAIDDMNVYIKIDPEKPRAYMWRATAYEQDGQLDKALADYQTGLKVSKNYEYRFHIARIYQKKGRLKDAIAEMTAVINQQPEEDEAWNKRATLYMEAGKYKEAVSDYTQALATNFGSGETIYRARARAYEKLGQKEQAQKDLKKAEELRKKPAVSPI